ncbi:DUF262 domain-containing protein [Marivirga tractuosa]|uniref:GmrSD restriction endonuclease domain-containing protein n=1 Tax=Marivirga tractuosa TaxID=1006 RepID=UPI0035CEE58F
MDNIKSIFNDKIFRIPDYQRGYSWDNTHLNDFWQDLMNLQRNRIHYTGMISVEEVQKKEYSEWKEDKWIIEGKNDKPYFIVDGQQRITTIIILIWTILDQIEEDQELSFESKDQIRSKYIYTENPKGDQRSYVFGYHKDNPSYEFLKQEIFEQVDNNQQIDLEETAYTNKLLNAKHFFVKKITGWNLKKLENLYNKVTKSLKFDFKILQEDLDIFIVFETMNNRGKPLSNLEKLKNRLIYLSTLLKDVEDENKKELRERINDKWKVIYKYLGLNKDKKLDDDSFLQSHWIMYMRYERREPEFYAIDIFDRVFTTQRALKGELKYEDVDNYINSIGKGARMWFCMYNPSHRHACEILQSNDLIIWLKKQNRLGFKAFAPLILAAFVKGIQNEKVLDLLILTEAYVFLIFNVSIRRSNTGTYHFNAMASQLYSDELTIDEIIDDISLWIYGDRDVHGYFDESNFYSFLKDLFVRDTTNGYHDWKYLRYFLYEYELYLNNNSENDMDWNKFKNIHYVMPQNPHLNCWKSILNTYSKMDKKHLSNSLGNFVLSTNKYDEDEEMCFEDQKHLFIKGCKMEQALVSYDNWGYEEIEQRGLDMLSFMEVRWDIDLGNSEQKNKLLFPYT